MSTFIENNRAGVRCDTCYIETQTVSNNNIMRAQRVAVNFFGWTVRNENGLWKHSCRKCVEVWKKAQYK